MIIPTWWEKPNQKDAYYLSIAGVVLELISSLAGFAGFVVLGSTLCLTYGLQNFVDLLSSIVALWRFYCPGELTKEQEFILKNREARAGAAISILIVALGVSIAIAAIGDLSEGPNDDVDAGLDLILMLSFLSILLYSVMSLLKIRFARFLQSDALYKDGLCSLIGVLISFIICLNSIIITNNAEMWKLDASLSIVCAVISMAIGIHGVSHAVLVDGYPIWSINWWKGEALPTEEPSGGKDNNVNTDLSEVV